jgi:hypothetical protein
MSRLDGSYRIRASSSTDEWWLALALGPGVLGGCVLRLLLGEGFWVVTGWTTFWLLVASVGTLWFWARHGTAHVFFVGVYMVVALLVFVLGMIAWR